MNILNTLRSFTVVTNDLLIKRKFVQKRFPKSKKKRIRQKWRKRYGKIKTFYPVIFMKETNTVAMHSHLLKQIKKESE